MAAGVSSYQEGNGVHDERVREREEEEIYLKHR